MILITGASRGIGKFLIKKFIANGEKVLGTYNNTILNSPLQSHLRKVDITNNLEISKLISEVDEKEDKIILLNCAGINYNAVGHKVVLGKWCEVINVNLIGTFNIISHVLPLMRNRNYGRIINFTSVVAQIGVPGTSAYSASKAGVWGMTRALAVENVKKGITINNINLGYFNIGMISEVPEEYKTVIKNKIPKGEFGDPEEIWKTVQYIINNNYLTGTSIDINGGLF